MDETQKKYLSDTQNYNDTILNDEMDVVRAFIDIINEYLFHAGDKIVITNHAYYIFVLKRGCDTIKHIFNILFMYTKNLELTVHHCKKAFLYYVEFIGQIGDDNHTFLQLNSKDATLFVYKKTIFDINNEYKKKVNFTINEQKKLKFINVSSNLFNELILFILDNENLKGESRLSYIMYAQKMVCKIFNKYINLPFGIVEKLNVCDCFMYYKSLLLTKELKDECKFLNLCNLYFKKIQNKKKIGKIKIKEKLFDVKCKEKLENLTALKFTNWLFN